MLRIHNGDSTAGTLRESGFPGEHFAFREALATGPAPQGLVKDAWFDVRANHLVEETELDAATIRQELAQLDASLANISGHEEIILWFEHDLFCQINLVSVVPKLARAARKV